MITTIWRRIKEPATLTSTTEEEKETQQKLKKIQSVNWQLTPPVTPQRSPTSTYQLIETTRSLLQAKR